MGILQVHSEIYPAKIQSVRGGGQFRRGPFCCEICSKNKVTFLLRLQTTVQFKYSIVIVVFADSSICSTLAKVAGSCHETEAAEN